MASIWKISILLVLVVGTANVESNTQQNAKKPIQTFRPYNIAHRGACGEIPEETTAAYLRAIEIGADFIETDILASKDGQLVCFHDVTLDDTTDVLKLTKFSGRKRTYEVQGSNVTGYFVVDFTLEELKSLKVKQRFSFRDQQYNGMDFSFSQLAFYIGREYGLFASVFLEQKCTIN